VRTPPFSVLTSVFFFSAFSKMASLMLLTLASFLEFGAYVMYFYFFSQKQMANEAIFKKQKKQFLIN